MKIRQGFVSNSSSSSFVIIGKKLYGNDINKALYSKNTNSKVFVRGDYYCEGEDFFRLTDEIFEFMEGNYVTDNFEFYLPYKQIDESGTIKKDDIPWEDGEVSVDSFEVDYHPTDCLEEFIRRYMS